MPTVLLADLRIAIARLGKRLIPGDALPLAFATLAHALLRIADTRRVVQLLRDGERTRAQRTFVEQIGVALDLQQAAVFHVTEQRATAIALTACARDLLNVTFADRRAFMLFVSCSRNRRGADKQRRSAREGRCLHEASTAHFQCHVSLLLTSYLRHAFRPKRVCRRTCRRFSGAPPRHIRSDESMESTKGVCPTPCKHISV